MHDSRLPTAQTTLRCCSSARTLFGLGLQEVRHNLPLESVWTAITRSERNVRSATVWRRSNCMHLSLQQDLLPAVHVLKVRAPALTSVATVTHSGVQLSLLADASSSRVHRLAAGCRERLAVQCAQAAVAWALSSAPAGSYRLCWCGAEARSTTAACTKTYFSGLTLSAMSRNGPCAVR